jgi:excisionase family DNA binding protein
MNDNSNIRLSVSEAAKLFGVSTRSIKYAIDNNEILYIVVRGRYKIHFGSLLEWSQRSTRRRNLFNNSGIGQFARDWNIKNQKFSPNPDNITKSINNKKSTIIKS